jgi:hypothetical protein
MDASGKRRNHINICGNLMLGSRQLPVCGVTVCSTGGVVEQVFVFMVAGHQQQAEPLQSFKRAVGQRQSRATHATAKQPPQCPSWSSSTTISRDQLRNIAASPIDAFSFEGKVRTIKKARSGTAIA